MPEQTYEINQPVNKPDSRFTTYHILGEPTGIRKIDVSSHEDIKRMWQIETSPLMTKYINETPEDANVNKKELREWIMKKSYDVKDRKLRNERSYTKLYAVTKNDKDFPDSEKPRSQDVEGWVRVDGSSAEVNNDQEKLRYERVTGEKLPSGENYPTPIELAAYIKRPAGPILLMDSAVRTVCHMIAAQDGEVDRNFFITDPNGKITPKRIIMAFVEPANTLSIRVLKEAGFDLKKEKVSWDEGELPEKNMYVLNWDKFHQIMEEKSKNRLLQRIEQVVPGLSNLKVIPQKEYPDPKKTEPSHP